MKYQTIFFDADQTLLDFEDAEHQALDRTFDEYGLSLNEETHLLYQKINRSLWDNFEKNLITKEDLLKARFAKLFESLSISGIDPIQFNKSYLYNLGFGCKTLPGAVELCKTLHQKGFRLYLLTNGVSQTQHRRLNGTELLPYFEDVFVSEETGFQKPLKGYFDYVFAHIENFDPKQTLMVGDSLSSDILGAYNAGLDSCWFNPNKKPAPEFPPITYTITDLQQLIPIVTEK